MPVPVRLRARTQLCDEPVPPQATVIVDVVLSQAPAFGVAVPVTERLARKTRSAARREGERQDGQRARSKRKHLSASGRSVSTEPPPSIVSGETRRGKRGFLEGAHRRHGEARGAPRSARAYLSFRLLHPIKPAPSLLWPSESPKIDMAMSISRATIVWLPATLRRSPAIIARLLATRR